MNNALYWVGDCTAFEHIFLFKLLNQDLKILYNLSVCNEVVGPVFVYVIQLHTALEHSEMQCVSEKTFCQNFV